LPSPGFPEREEREKGPEEIFEKIIAENSPVGGHGNPLQYSCLENPMERGAW